MVLRRQIPESNVLGIQSLIQNIMFPRNTYESRTKNLSLQTYTFQQILMELKFPGNFLCVGNRYVLRLRIRFGPHVRCQPGFPRFPCTGFGLEFGRRALASQKEPRAPSTNEARNLKGEPWEHQGHLTCKGPTARHTLGDVSELLRARLLGSGRSKMTLRASSPPC